KFNNVIPAMAAKLSQLKWCWRMGVSPLGAQVLARCGLCVIPLSSTKTTVRPSVRAFFLSQAIAFSSNERWLFHLSPRLGLLVVGNSSPAHAEFSRHGPCGI